MKSLIGLVLGIVAFFAAVVPAASADRSGVPDEVLTAFSDSAQNYLTNSSLTPMNPEDPVEAEQLQYPYGTKVGTPIEVLRLNDAFFAAAKPSVDVLDEVLYWLAPLVSEGKPVGTVMIYLGHNGKPEFPVFDDDVVLGTALMTLEAGDIVVGEPANGHFVINGNAVRQVKKDFASSASLAQLQGAINEQRAWYAAEAKRQGVSVLFGVTPVDLTDYIARESDSSTANATPIVAEATWLPVTLATAGVGVALLLMILTINSRRNRDA